MARIAYAPVSGEDQKSLVSDIRAQRGEVPHLYRMLLHSAPVAEGWLKYLTAIRQKSLLPGALREMVIIRIAHINNAPYEAEQHIPIALKEGVPQAAIDALKDWRAASVFTDEQRAVLAYADAMTKQIQTPDADFAAVRRLFDDRVLVELTATIAAYNMVSRFLEALEIHSHDEVEG